MTVQKDPEGAETAALFDFAEDFAGKQVLEIGCGYGRMTWRFAASASRVVAIDPDPGKISRARNEMPPTLQGRVEFQALTLEQFESTWRASPVHDPYDLAILSWSL